MSEVFEVGGNSLELLTEGPDRLERLIALIDGAAESLRVLYYIYTDGEAGTRIADALIRAAGRGVTVSLIVDGMGSEVAQANKFFEPLRDAGIDMCRFVPRWGRRYLLRNHQKLALADEARAIIGGFNVDDAYFGTAAEQAWRDLGLAVEGPAAKSLAGYFDALSRWSKQERPPMRALTRVLHRWSEPSGPTRWLFGGPTRRPSPWARTVRADMKKADNISLISGYFAPNPAMLRRLDRAGKRGCVRIVLPSKNDHHMAIWASRFTYRGLIKKRVEIYEYQPTKLHTKLFVIDDAVYIGSANFDIRSLFLNLELMLRIEDKAFAAHARAYVDGEVARSERITAEINRARSSIVTRIKQALAYFVMATLDLNITRRLNIGPPMPKPKG
ncbi:phospholipase D-like domain-containing protein [Sphingomonas antarctica]|uniref:phospholipase D-like domain-containing protein n=1 Tax=Sphingomonas antarctica TaxID=2040274 RepID=UPI0039EADC22